MAQHGDLKQGVPMTGPIDLETDIRLARRYRVPVLISAPPEHALAVAASIAARSDEDQTTSRMVMWNGAAIVSAALDRPAHRMTNDEEVVLLPEVHTLSDTEQVALMLLCDENQTEQRQIIASSSICLFGCVSQGKFNAGLFYRLNHIHIVSDSGGDRARTGTVPSD